MANLEYKENRASTGTSQLNIVLMLKGLQAFGYYSVSIILTSYLTAEMGMSDSTAGLVYGLLGMLISIASLIAGNFVDHFGIWVSIITGSALLVVARLCLAFSEDSTVALVVISTLLPFGEALGIPVLSQAVGAVSAPEDLQWSYGMFYTTMNVAVLAVGPSIDFARANATFILMATGLTPFRFTLLVSSACAVLSIAVTMLFLKRHVPVARRTAPATRLNPTLSHDDGGGDSSTPADGLTSTSIWTLGFKKYVTLVICLVGVRVLLRHLDATFPKFMTRKFGEQASFGTIYAINPATIIILVPFLSHALSNSGRVKGSLSGAKEKRSPVQGVLQEWMGAVAALPPCVALLRPLRSMSTMDLIAVGTTISSLSALIIVASPTVHGVSLFVLALSVGEALWSPNFYNYTYSIAPDGQSGRYFALANVPLFLPKFLAGVLSGYLLEEYCAGGKNQHCWLSVCACKCVCMCVCVHQMSACVCVHIQVRVNVYVCVIHKSKCICAGERASAYVCV
eukprot:m.1216411 g.1216411  ORF g.1216411 m.1216411 type:complete len:511 (-) comp24613_c0_seq32:181-1713(-)